MSDMHNEKRVVCQDCPHKQCCDQVRSALVWRPERRNQGAMSFLEASELWNITTRV